MVLNEGRAPSKQHEIAACVPTENLQAAKAHSSRQGPQNEPADSEPRASVEPEQVQLQAELSRSVHCLTAILCTKDLLAYTIKLSKTTAHHKIYEVR